MGTGSFLGVKSGRGVTLTPHPLLVPWSWKSRAIPLLPLWAVQTVQSLSACTRVHFTFFTLGLHSWHLYISLIVKWCDSPRFWTAPFYQMSPLMYPIVSTLMLLGVSFHRLWMLWLFAASWNGITVLPPILRNKALCSDHLIPLWKGQVFSYTNLTPSLHLRHLTLRLLMSYIYIYIYI